MVGNAGEIWDDGLISRVGAVVGVAYIAAHGWLLNSARSGESTCYA
jgi:hypothetical protein